MQTQPFRGRKGGDDTLARIERKLALLEEAVKKSGEEVHLVGQQAEEARRLWQPQSAELLHNRVLKIEDLAKRAINFRVKGVALVDTFTPFGIALCSVLRKRGFCWHCAQD